MDKKSLAESLKELSEKFSVQEIARRSGVSRSTVWYIINEISGTTLKTVEKIAGGFDLIPIVFYRESDGKVEDLGIEGFLCGEEVDNYVGRVILKQRELHELTPEKISENIFPSRAAIYHCEKGSSPQILNLEKLAEYLQMVPEYLVPKLKGIPQAFYDRHFDPIVAMMKKYLIVPPNEFDLNSVDRLLINSGKIVELHNALSVKYVMMNK